MAKEKKQIIEVGQHLRDLVLNYTALSNEITLSDNSFDVHCAFIKQKDIADDIASYVVHNLCEYDVESHLFLNKNL